MKRCPTFHCCGILDFNVFSYELANGPTQQQYENVLRHTCHWKYYCQYSFSINMKWSFPSFVSSTLVFQFFHYKSISFKIYFTISLVKWCQAFFSSYHLSFWQYICLVANCPFQLQYEEETIVFCLLLM